MHLAGQRPQRGDVSDLLQHQRQRTSSSQHRADWQKEWDTYVGKLALKKNHI